MFARFSSVLFALLVAPFSGLAAQSAPADPGPLSAEASVRPPIYDSAFANYRRFAEEKLTGWREVNDEVGRVGGHVGIFGGVPHAGHGGVTAKPTAGIPGGQKPQPASPTHGKDHGGMTK